MDNVKVINGQWHVKCGKTYTMRSNFIFRILYEVQHPQDSIFVVYITTDQGISGEAHFKTGDLHNPKEFQVTLNRTFKLANLLCYFKQTELLRVVSTLSAEARLQGSIRKCMIGNAGLQQGTPFIFLGPSQIIDLRSGKMETPAENPFVWLTDPLLRGPRIDLIREIQLPISTTPLADFLDLAVEKLELNAGPAILSWAAMYSLQLYRKWMAEVRHINLPVLYGPPTAGKTTIAQCGAWLNGCSEIHIASRCTLAFVTQWITTSSVPFVWDDPTTSEEVAQLAVDLGNGAVRGKATEDPKTPLTGCLVTANFDLSCLLKYFSRLFVMKINKTQRKKQTGEAKTLEDAAMTASCALPLVLQELNKTTINDIQEAVTAIEFDTDIRILEGIALPLVCAKKILRLVGRGQYLEKVTDYIQEVLKPYYLETLESCAAPGETSVTKPAPDFRRCVIQTIVANAHCLDEVTLVKGSLVAIRANIIPRNIQKQMTEMAKTNQTARFQGKPRKCLTIGRDMFSEEEWGLILKAIDGQGAEETMAVEEPRERMMEEEREEPEEMTTEEEPEEMTTDEEQAEEMTTEEEKEEEPEEMTTEEEKEEELEEMTSEEEEEPEEMMTEEKPEEMTTEEEKPEEMTTEEEKPEEMTTEEEKPEEMTTEEEKPEEMTTEEEKPEEMTTEKEKPEEMTTEEEKPKEMMTEEEKPEEKKRTQEEQPDEKKRAQEEQPDEKKRKQERKQEKQPNPFPVPKRAAKKITCGICSTIGRRGMRWVCCDGCNIWFHQKCSKISPSHFKMLDNKDWFCPSCV